MQFTRGVCGDPQVDFRRQYARKPATPGADRYSPANTTRSMLPKFRQDGITALFVFDAPMNGEIFLAYLELCADALGW
jgi:hypothetical protein